MKGKKDLSFAEFTRRKIAGEIVESVVHDGYVHFSCENETATSWLRHGIAEFSSRIQPELGCVLGVAKSFFLGAPMGHATWKLRNFRDESVVLGAPVDVDRIPDSPSYLNSFSLQNELRFTPRAYKTGFQIMQVFREKTKRRRWRKG